MTKEKELEIENDLGEIARVTLFVEELCAELLLPPETTMHINLALEEAVCNIIRYAYPPEERHFIMLKVTFNEQQLVFLLTDNGYSFDPTKVADPDIDLPLEKRPIGGLGIFLIRNIMNEVSYQRLDGQNRLIMKKNI